MDESWIRFVCILDLLHDNTTVPFEVWRKCHGNHSVPSDTVVNTPTCTHTQYFSESVYHFNPISSLAQLNSCPELWWPEATVSMCHWETACVCMLECVRVWEYTRQRSARAEGWQTVYLSVTEQLLVNLAPSSPAIISLPHPEHTPTCLPLFLMHTPATAWKYMRLYSSVSSARVLKPINEYEYKGYN